MVKYQSSGMDRTFSALADPTRRGVLARLMDEPGLSVTELARPFDLKLPGMMKHLDVLFDAGLITRSKTGRTVSHVTSMAALNRVRDVIAAEPGVRTRLDFPLTAGGRIAALG